MNIIYAGYGVWNKCKDCTSVIQQDYENGTRKFFANNELVGDPSPGDRKYLFIVWQKNNVKYSAVIGENDGKGIDLP